MRTRLRAKLTIFEIQPVTKDQQYLLLILDLYKILIYVCINTVAKNTHSESSEFNSILYIQKNAQSTIHYMCSMFFFGGSLNTKGFSSQVASNSSTHNPKLPHADHITYAGLFNQIQFDVGPKTNKICDLHHGFCRASNPSSVEDKSINQFLAIFAKGCMDGEPRDNRILNSVIILDISGSMAGKLQPKSEKTRLDLSKQAIKMFVSKLKPEDSFGLVTFNSKGATMIKQIRKNDIDIEVVFGIVDSIKANGGTTLIEGLNEGQKVLNQFNQNLSKNSEETYENRLIMLTDVGDNSISTTNKFIQQMSNSNINTTIVGISSQFRSDICQQLNQIKGFNYFCAVETDDLKKYLFQNFDWTFFPSSYTIQIKLESENVKYFEVFGSPDSEKINQYNNFAKKGLNEYIISKVPTAFPSQVKIVDGVTKTIGGLFLVKLSPQNNLDNFSGKLILRYRTIKGDSVVQQYPINYNFPKNQQFFSQKCLEQAISAFYFVHEIKGLLKFINNSNEGEFEKEKYIQSLKTLKTIAPPSKQEQVDGMIKILENFKK